MDKLFTLKEVCKLLNVSRRVIQGYEKHELIHTTYKNKYGHLLYDQKTIKQIITIRFYQMMNFRLKEIKLLIQKDEKTIDIILKRQLLKLKKDLIDKENKLLIMEGIVNKELDITEIIKQ